jgi:hypothetical protein
LHLYCIKAIRRFPSGLYLRARYGLPYLTERLLMANYRDSNIGAGSKDSYDRTLLSIAVAGGHEALVRLDKPNLQAH